MVENLKPSVSERLEVTGRQEQKIEWNHEQVS